jgi:hypothetical protein
MVMYSIYHFFASLMRSKQLLVTAEKIQPQQFDIELFSSYKSTGKFPDMIIRLNTDDPEIEGGELIELKDCDSYTVASFNSTIPPGKRDLTKILKPNSKMWRDMQRLGEDIESHPIRDVFYFVRGRKAGNIKICLVHGSFFETISPTKLITGAVQQVLEEKLSTNLDEEMKATLLRGLSEQESFSRVRHVSGASVSIRFRVMTEVTPSGNILQYPEIEDNTLNFVLSSHSPEQDETEQGRLRRALTQLEYDQLAIRRIKHPLNGHFQVFQIPIN